MMELFGENFDITQVVRSTRQVPIDQLSKQLSKLVESVQDELFELINHDFVKFQEILRNVCDVDMKELKDFRDSVAEAKLSQEVSTFLKSKVLIFIENF